MTNTPDGPSLVRRPLLVALALLSTSGLATEAARAEPPSAHEIARQMVCRCGDCGDQTFDQCAPGCANGQKMRAEIAARVKQGGTQEQILDFFASKYGEQILGAPRSQGFNRLAILTPALAVALGLVPLGLMLRSRRRHDEARLAPAPADDRESKADDPRVAEALRGFDF